jgi:GMP synthase (glutamine-hydrolysing)
MVSHRESWMLSTETWLANVVAAGIPVLGICFGHQLLAQALGGQVDDNPKGTEVGTVTIELADDVGADALFNFMPKRFPAQVSHRQSVLQLPPGAKRLGISEKEPHQAIAFGPRAWGIQFHPEFDARIIDHFIHHHAPSVAATGGDVEVIKKNTRPTPESSSLLLRFAELVHDSKQQ